jgi:DNA-binding FadR family transcriptional regulator
VRAIETADGDGARTAMSQVLARTASLWVEEIA